MPLRILSWLTGGRWRAKPPRPTPYRPAPAAPVAPSPATAAVEPVPAAPANPAPEPAAVPDLAAAETLRRHLDGEIAEALKVLDATLSAEDRAGDSGALLQDLRGDITGTIRRPPIAAQQALNACRDPNASLGQILEAFHQDPALTQSLLKQSNSPFYAAAGPVASLDAAAGRIGLVGLHGVLMASMVEGLLCRPGGEYGTMVQQVWNHMVRTAPSARRIGRAIGAHPEKCYTLGLLHDLGKLIVFDRLTAMRTAGRQTLRIPRTFLRDVLGRLHGPIGGVAALQWNLDVESARAIAAHPRETYRQYQDSWYGDIGFTLEESEGETLSQVLAVAEWWDLTTTIRHERPDFETFWARTGLTISIDDCKAALDETR